MSQNACPENGVGRFDLPYTEVTSMNVLNKSRGQPRWGDHPSRWLDRQPEANYGKESQLVTKIYTGHISAPVQTCPGSNPASYTIGAGSFLGIKRSGRGVDQPPHIAQRLKKRVELYL
jgi:hypothetical protein